MSARAHSHFLEERCTWTCDRLPWITMLLLLSNLVCFSLRPADLSSVSYKATESSQQWSTVWTYAFFHVDEYHLLSNMLVFVPAGALLEATDSNARMVIVTLCGIPYAAMGHGLFERTRGVIGFSGVVYAVIVYQLALLSKNWKEMRCRPTHTDPWVTTRAFLSSSQIRLVVFVFLFVAEIILSSRSSTISLGGHIVGGISGLFVGLAIGSNVRLDWWEVLMPLVGVVGHLSLALAGFCSIQVASGTYGLLLTPLLSLFAAKELMLGVST